MFAEATGDRQWIHVDTERAKRELPDGRTIAHGNLILSLIPLLSEQIKRVVGIDQAINYGFNRVRFVQPVNVGDAIRITEKVLAFEPAGENSVRVRSGIEIAKKGADGIVCAVEEITLYRS